MSRLSENLATYYRALWKFGVTGQCPASRSEVEHWCLFAIFQHLCFNPGHPGFARTAHMYETVFPDRLAKVAGPVLRVGLYLVYLPLMVAYPLLTALVSDGDHHLALSAPFAWLDRRFRSQNDQTAVGLLNTSVDLTLLAHRPAGDDLLDKSWFFQCSEEQGLSSVPCYSPASPPPTGTTVWIKPRRGGNGDGHRKAVVDATLLSQLDLLCETHTVQALESNHPDVDEVSPDSLASLRIRTLHASDGAIVGFGLADIKLARPGNIVSNVSKGGLAVLVDERGTLEADAIDLGGTRYPGHPDTGTRFEGRMLPFYDEAIELCRRAHRAIAPDLFVIGWDVALTPRGPVILEPNLFPHLAEAVRPRDVEAYKERLVPRLAALYAERPRLFRKWASARTVGAVSWAVLMVGGFVMLF